MPADTWWERRASIGRTWTAVKAWPCDEEECYMTYLPNPKGLIYINSRVSGKTILLDCFSFPCSIGVDFFHRFVENLTSECMEAFMVVLIYFL
jgi:hypothetical protein